MREGVEMFVDEVIVEVSAGRGLCPFALFEFKVILLFGRTLPSISLSISDSVKNINGGKIKVP